MKKITWLFTFIIAFSNLYGQGSFRYDLSKPDLKHQLPPILNEISGLTDVDNSHVACVQDELGIVFLYDFKNGEIVSQHPFDSIGDFEGLTYTKNALYILRSDGRLTEWKNFPDNKLKSQHFQLPLVTGNNEGLCFDHKNNHLLIAAKSKPFEKSDKAERYIYAFDLATHKLDPKPKFSINVDDLGNKMRTGKASAESGKKGKKKEKSFNFRPASLAVHPVSDDIYIISANDFLLVIMNRKGEIIHTEALPQSLYTKAEGITFLPDGTMIITNEAGGKSPTLYVFNMDPVSQ